MALGTYQGLLDAIPAWLHRSGDADVIAAAPDFVTLAESGIYARLRTRYQELNFAQVMQSGVISLPANYTDVKWAYIEGTPIQNLTRKSVDYILSQFPLRAGEARPRFFARDGVSLIFGPSPDAAYEVKGVFYIAETPLSVSGSNGLFLRYPKLYLYGSLLQAEGFIRNDPTMNGMMQVWAELYRVAIEEAQGDDDREAMSGGRARVSVAGVAP